MGFFAVSSRNSTAKISIPACHLTFWILPKHWFRGVGIGFNYLFDIGLRIKAESDLRRIRIALPFDSDPGALIDLSSKVLDPNFAPLIFGRPVSIKGNLLTYEAQDLYGNEVTDRVVSVSSANSTPESETDPRFSVWTVELNEPIRAGETAYVRFRIKMKNRGALWTSKGWGFAKRGTIADLRVTDIRESVLLGLGRNEAMHIVEIEKLFLFLGVPSYFVPNHYSPPLHYSRLLEPEVWRDYLQGKYERHTRISMHQWRSNAPIDADRPFRAYMDLSREFGRAIWIFYALGASALPILWRVIDRLIDTAIGK